MAKGPSKVDAMRAMREAAAKERELPSREKYANAIRRSVSSTVESIIETGRLLVNAKAELRHGEFVAMVREDLPFEARTAQRFMAIATCAHISNPTHGSLLPPSWRTLYELSRLTDDEWKAVGPHVTPELQRKDIKALLPAKTPDVPPVPEVQEESAETPESPVEETAEPTVTDPPEAVDTQESEAVTARPDSRHTILIHAIADLWAVVDTSEFLGYDRDAERLSELIVDIEKLANDIQTASKGGTP